VPDAEATAVLDTSALMAVLQGAKANVAADVQLIR
jgi:hypothetical protein